VDDCFHGLCRAPGSSQERRPVRVRRAALVPDGQARRRRHVVPVEPRGLPVDPVRSFGNWIFREWKPRRVRSATGRTRVDATRAVRTARSTCTPGTDSADSAGRRCSAASRAPVRRSTAGPARVPPVPPAPEAPRPPPPPVPDLAPPEPGLIAPPLAPPLPTDALCAPPLTEPSGAPPEPASSLVQSTTMSDASAAKKTPRGSKRFFIRKSSRRV
jgi:hypothetical protein